MKQPLSIEITVGKALTFGFAMAWGWRFANAVYDLVVIIIEYLFTWAGMG